MSDDIISIWKNVERISSSVQKSLDEEESKDEAEEDEVKEDEAKEDEAEEDEV